MVSFFQDIKMKQQKYYKLLCARKTAIFATKKSVIMAEQQIGKMNGEKRQTEKSIGKVTNGMEIGIGQSVDRGDKPINRPRSDQGEV